MSEQGYTATGKAALQETTAVRTCQSAQLETEEVSFNVSPKHSNR
jgi:hypothetical protein